MNMFKDTKSKSVKEYLENLPADRKDIILFLHKFIQKTSPRLKSYFAYNMLGYGKFPYKNYKKEVVEWPIVALANQKNSISIYICSIEGGKYLVEKYKKDLGKVSAGKSCVRFKKIEDLNLPELKRILIKAARRPGLES